MQYITGTQTAVTVTCFLPCDCFLARAGRKCLASKIDFRCSVETVTDVLFGDYTQNTINAKYIKTLKNGRKGKMEASDKNIP